MRCNALARCYRVTAPNEGNNLANIYLRRMRFAIPMICRRHPSTQTKAAPAAALAPTKGRAANGFRAFYTCKLMQATLEIDDDVLKAAQLRAQQQGLPLGKLLSIWLGKASACSTGPISAHPSFPLPSPLTFASCTERLPGHPQDP